MLSYQRSCYNNMCIRISLVFHLWLQLSPDRTRVKSGNFGYQETLANSGDPDETALNKPSHQDFYCLLS